MGILRRMSRNMRLSAAVMCLLLLCAGPVLAQEAVERKDELAYRVALGRAEDITMLIGKGGDPNSANKEGLPLLLVAASRKDSEALPAVQALLEGGARVNIKDNNGQTALYYAARSGKAEVVDYLLKNKIDYYSLDNNGDIARTIAYRAGRSDIVKIMDDYVKSQTLQAENIYKTAEKMAAEQAAAEQRKIDLEAKRQREQAASIKAKQAAERNRKLEEYKENLKTLDQKVYDISYNACAFQYWSFGLAANQTMEITDEETEELIDIHKDAVQETSLEVMKMFNVGQSYVNKIIVPSKQYVYNQLASMPSRTYRKENGVGKLMDVHKRCDRIAKMWDIKVPDLSEKAQPQASAAKPKAKPKQKSNKRSKKKPAKKYYPNQTMTFK
jgi:ankyrin repeat protein